MRKLFILFPIFFILNASAQKNPCDPTGLPYSSVPGDTTIVLPQGTQVTFNRCEFFDLRKCLEFDEIFDRQSIIEAGFTTQDRQGNILISCGMFRIRLTPGCSGKTCFEIPVKVRMPFRFNFSDSGKVDSCAMCNSRGIRLFTANAESWSDSSNLEYKIIDIQGKKYFEFYTPCANIAYNCDCRHNGATKIKFKAKHGQQLKELSIRSACPVGVLKFTQEKPKRKIIVKVPCPYRKGNLIISARGTSSSGESIQFGPRELGQLDHGNNKKNCSLKKGKVIRRILGIFPVREGSYYKKYYIR